MPSKDYGTVDSVDKYVTEMGSVTGLEYIVNGKDDSDEEEMGHSKSVGKDKGTSENDDDTDETDTSDEVDDTDEELEEEDSDEEDDSDDDEDTDEEIDEHDDSSEGDSHEDDSSAADSADEKSGHGSDVDSSDDKSDTEGYKRNNGDKPQAADMPANGHSVPTGAKEIASAATIATCAVAASREVNSGHEISSARGLVIKQEHIGYQNPATDQSNAYGSRQNPPIYPPQTYGERKIAPTYPPAYGEHGVAPTYPQPTYEQHNVAPNHPLSARGVVTHEEHFTYNETVLDHPDILVRDFANPNNAPPHIKKLGRFQSFTGSIKSTISDKEKREKMVHGIQSGLEHVKDALNEHGAKGKGIARSGTVQAQVVETYHYVPVPEHQLKTPSKTGKAASTGLKVGKGVLKVVGFKIVKHHPAFSTVWLAKGVYDALEHSPAKVDKK